MVKKRASEQSKKKASAKIIEHKDDNNKPRNHLILDAAKPFFFDYTQFGSKVRMTIHQTPSAETWPGGALWDLGVILAKLLVSWTRGATYPQATPLPNALSVYSTSTWKDTTVGTWLRNGPHGPCGGKFGCQGDHLFMSTHAMLSQV